MKKKVIAFVIAFAITGIVALAMLVVGVNAAFNKNSVAVSNSPAQAALSSSTSSVSSSADPKTQIAQLQSQVAQYQAALQNAQAQLNQAQQQMQTVQQLMTYLQQHGIISIDSQGNITVNAGRRDNDGFGGFGG